MAEKSVGTQSLAMKAEQKYAGKKFRVAIIGCGGISQLHAESFKGMPDVEMVAGVDIVPDRLTSFEKRWGVTKLYKDWKKMLKEVQPVASHTAAQVPALASRV